MHAASISYVSHNEFSLAHVGFTTRMPTKRTSPLHRDFGNFGLIQLFLDSVVSGISGMVRDARGVVLRAADEAESVRQQR